MVATYNFGSVYIPKVDSIETDDEMAVKVKVGSRESFHHSSYTSFSSNNS